MSFHACTDPCQEDESIQRSFGRMNIHKSQIITAIFHKNRECLHLMHSWQAFRGVHELWMLLVNDMREMENWPSYLGPKLRVVACVCQESAVSAKLQKSIEIGCVTASAWWCSIVWNISNLIWDDSFDFISCWFILRIKVPWNDQFAPWQAVV